MKNMTAENHGKKAIIYCRVSTVRQSDNGTSLDTQAAACVEKAEELGYQVERITKEVYTGTALSERPQLNLDRAEIRAGKVDALIIYAIDRLSRNIAHLAIIDEECKQAKCELIFVQEDMHDRKALTQYDASIKV
jgi:site-specific DNA recombinase